MNLKEFIEVTSIYDGKKALIRAACIEAVIDDAAVCEDFAGRRCVTKPDCRTIKFSGTVFEAMESLDEISNMIYKAEL